MSIATTAVLCLGVLVAGAAIPEHAHGWRWALWFFGMALIYTLSPH